MKLLPCLLRILEHDAVHADLLRASDVLYLVINEHTIAGIDIETLAEGLIDSHVGLKEMYLVRHEIAVEQTERPRKLLHHIEDLCRPVGQT